MDFFGHQEQAQRRTYALFIWFACAVVVVVLAVYAAVTVGLFVGQLFQGNSFQSQTEWIQVHAFWHKARFLWVSAIAVALIVAGSAYKIYQLRQGGGAAVADMLGGKRLPSNVGDVLARRLLNVVEEMAIASGLPVPPVYILNQSGINAFAAGFSPSDTVIGVTRGAIEMLNRDELQGVIAHEFSHILHGDTRINMRMMGLLHGMTLISDTGMFLLTARRSARHSRHRRGTHPAMFVLGFLLFLVGLIGMIMADLIKRAVSRQREFLADASAVQFTRNPEGIANALKVIGGYKAGSQVRHADASPVGHFFFGNALKRAAVGVNTTRWWASHPPLLERIRRIEPRFRGQLMIVQKADKQQRVLAEATMGFSQAMDADVSPIDTTVNDYQLWLAAVGKPEKATLARACKQLQRIPDRLRDFAHDSYTARAVCYALLLDADDGQRHIQMSLLEQSADKNVLREMLDIQREVMALSADLRLPLIDTMLPALKAMSGLQYQMFVKNIRILMQANHRISLFEYMLQRLLLRHLKPNFTDVKIRPVKYRKIQGLAAECGCVLGMLIGYGAHAEPETLFEKVITELLGETMPWPPARVLQLARLDASLSKFECASPSVKKALLAACMQVILADGLLHVKESEALRAIADGMDCPIPVI
ncbi:MAG: peptidase M48 [Proteobacteria bacterium]|nr:MAG: peptidase M48 [Pseudomonadota bacterium]